MKAGLTTSSILHVVIIGAGLVSFSSPKSLEVADVEALPIELITLSELTQLQEGAKEAPKTEKAAPVPTSKPDIVPNAQKAGDQARDLENDANPDLQIKPIEKTAAAAPEAKPEPKPVPIKPDAKPDPAPTPKPEQTPTPKLAQETKPVEEVAPQPEVVPAEAAPAEAEFAETPANVPAPQARPEPPKPQTATSTERKAEEAKEAAKKAPSEEKSLEDDVAALINKEKAAGGGAKRSEDQASLGATRTTGGDKLSASEMDALRQQIQKCWNPPFGVADATGLKVTVKMQLNQNGEIEGRPEVVSGGGDSGVGRAAAESARRAVMICAPYRLPADKFETWKDVVINFDPTQMFR